MASRPRLTALLQLILPLTRRIVGVLAGNAGFRSTDEYFSARFGGGNAVPPSLPPAPSFARREAMADRRGFARCGEEKMMRAKGFTD